jgi:hypothetical protein
VALAHAVEPRLLAAADEIARRLALGRGDLDRREQAGRVQAGQLASVAGVGLDALARPGRDESRRHHLAGDAPSASWR